jgi:hypothetical protein
MALYPHIFISYFSPSFRSCALFMGHNVFYSLHLPLNNFIYSDHVTNILRHHVDPFSSPLSIETKQNKSRLGGTIQFTCVCFAPKSSGIPFVRA